MDPNVLFEDGNRAIHIAAASGILPLVQWLVENGADIWLTNTMNESPRDIAEKRGYRQIVRYLEKKSIDYDALFANYYNAESDISLCT
tara:strand:- start:203 stop:466 length:264 start_codon:yes stop_codon:yes gene_type:complete